MKRLLSAAMCCAATPALANMICCLNISAMELALGKVPGVNGTDYTVPSPAELTYYRSKGGLLIRPPMKWERIQPHLLARPLTPANNVLDEPYLALVRGAVGKVNRRGQTVIIDIHNNGQHWQNWIGAGVATNAMFADFWARLAKRLAGFSVGYDLMNEPENMPSATAWPDAAQPAVDAIRAIDAVSTIYLEGDN